MSEINPSYRAAQQQNIDTISQKEAAVSQGRFSKGFSKIGEVASSTATKLDRLLFYRESGKRFFRLSLEGAVQTNLQKKLLTNGKKIRVTTSRGETRSKTIYPLDRRILFGVSSRALFAAVTIFEMMRTPSRFSKIMNKRIIQLKSDHNSRMVEAEKGGDRSLKTSLKIKAHISLKLLSSAGIAFGISIKPVIVSAVHSAQGASLITLHRHQNSKIMTVLNRIRF